MANEVSTLSTDIHVITAEIKTLETSMLQHFTQHAWLIGERLTRVKAILPHGRFQPYVRETLSYTPQYARNFMKVYADSPKGIPSFFLPSLKHLFEVSTLPSEVDRQQFVEQPHTIPSTGEQKTVDEMTVRELREVKAELKRKQAELDAAKRSEQIVMTQNERLSDELASATKPETVVVEKEVERIVEVDKTDYTAVEKLKQYEERFGAIENYSDRVRASNVDDVTTSIISFNMAVRDFIKRHAYLIKYQDTVGHIDKITQREYVEAVSALKSIAADFGKVTGTADYVDVEFSEVQ